MVSLVVVSDPGVAVGRLGARKAVAGITALSLAIALVGAAVIGSPAQARADEAIPSVEPSVAEAEFVEATVADGYTNQGAVTEAVGVQQQMAAVGAAGAEVRPEDQVDRSPAGAVDVNIVRVDLDTQNALIGVTWDLDASDPTSVSLRYLSDGQWSQWTSLEIANGPEGRASARGGTEPFSVFFSDAVEVVARSDDGQSVPGLSLVVIDAESDGEIDNALSDLATDAVDVDESAEETDVNESAEDGDVNESAAETTETEESSPLGDNSSEEVADKAPPSEPTEVQEPASDVLLDLDGAAVGEDAALEGPLTGATSVIPAALTSTGTVFDTGFEGLKINTRKAWGANESLMTWTPKANNIKGAVVHHTESSNNYTQGQVAQQIRNIYSYHAKTLGWGDIGYNVIVDKFGGVWEGRAGGLNKMIHAAHAGNANGATFGITVMGSFMGAAPIAAAQDAVAKTIAWKLQLHGINSVAGNISVLHQSGKYVSVPVISAHRDVGWTDCPGDAFYNQMGSVRSKVATYLKNNAPSTGSGSSTATKGLSASFNAANIISDGLFYNPGAMTEAQIKAKIQEVGKDCKPGTGTTCLKDTTFPTVNLKTLRGGCKALNMSGNQAPWTIIKKTADACGLNPQVILTTLQKEQSGLTQAKSAATWAKAMGAGCPDNSGCDAKQGGFQKQVYYGADKLVSYRLQSQAGHVDAFKAGKAITVKHNPDARCGTQSLKFANAATASLYEYTPYIGNSSTSGCGATGQKNFYDIYKRYFPATVGVQPSVPALSSGPITWLGWSQIGHGWSKRAVFAGDLTGNGTADLMLIDGNGALWMYAGLSGERFAKKVRVGSGWQVMDWVGGGVDWNGDGKVDLLARVKSTGEIRLYPGLGNGRFGRAVTLINGARGLKNMTVGPIPNGVGLYAVEGDRLVLYPAGSRGAVKPKVTYGTGWSPMTSLIAVRDWSGDGVPDLLARKSDGLLYLYAGNGSGGFRAAQRIGTGWNMMVAVDVANPTVQKSNLWGVTSQGILRSYRIR